MADMGIRHPLHERWPQLAWLGYGGASLGNLYTEVDDATCEAAVDLAWELGMRYFDTAPHYGLGLSERRLGRALQKYPRDEYLLSTKVGRLVRPNPHPTGERGAEGYAVPDDLMRVRDYSPEGVRTSLAESLERLGLDRVDIVYIHDPDDYFDEAMAGAVPALQELRADGVIQAWGAGMNQAEMLADFAREADPDLLMLAGRFTLLEQGAGTTLMPICREKGIGVVNVGVFNSGLLAQDRPPRDAHYNYEPAARELIDRADRLADVCERFGVTLPQAAVAFSATEPAVANVTIGMRRPEHVRRNIDLAGSRVPDELWDALAAEGLMQR